jgi:hypothetical protein
VGSPREAPVRSSGSGDDSILLGCRESELGDSAIGEVLETLVPSYREYLTPVQLPTYLGRIVFHRQGPEGDSDQARVHGGFFGEGLYLV